MDVNAANWANYKSLSRLSVGTGTDAPIDSPYYYFASKENPSFIVLGRIPEKARTEDIGFGELRNYVQGGDWKFHISVHHEDVALAWDSIVSYLQKEGVAKVKVVTPDLGAEFGIRFEQDGEHPNVQAGKMFTLYAYDQVNGKPAHSVEDWQRIINGIEKRLAQAGVRKGLEVITDANVPGSMYSYYRSDRITNALKDFLNAVRPEYYQDVLNFDAHMPTDVNVDTKIIQKLADEHLHNFTPQEIAASIPQTLADTESERRILLNFPRYKRYKLENEKDPYFGLHIEEPNILRAMQEKAIKERGIQER